MKLFLALLVVLLLVTSCGERGDSSQAKFKIFSGYFADTQAQFPGGLLIMGKKADGTQSFLLPYQPNLELDLKKGTWDFATIGWLGPNPMEGNQQCSFQKTDLTTDIVSVSFNMSYQNCLNMAASDGSRFSSPLFYNFMGGSFNGFKKLKVKTCPNLINDCSYGVQHPPTYYKISIPSRLFGIPATPLTNGVFQSRCILSDYEGRSDITPPHGGPNGFIGTQITTYKAVQATLNSPEGVAVDNNGNVFVADSSTHTIRKIATDGTVSTLAGLANNYGTTNGTGSNARFYGPRSLAVDSNGDIYVADQGNNLIRKVAPDATVTTIAGDGTYAHADGTGTAAQFLSPRGLVLDGSGNLFVSEYSNTIRKIDLSTGVVTTVAGSNGSVGSADNADPLLAKFSSPESLAIDASGNIYVADIGSNAIRKIAAGSLAVTTIAGTNNSSGLVDGPGTSAKFDRPQGLIIDKVRNVLYVADHNNNVIRKVDLNDINYTVSTLAGGDYTHNGSADGIGTNARFTSPFNLAIKDNQLFISDYGNHTVRRLDLSNNGVSTIAGIATAQGAIDGLGVVSACGNGEVKDYFFPHGFGEQLNSTLTIGGTGLVRRGALSIDANANDTFVALSNLKYLGFYSYTTAAPAGGQMNEIYYYNGGTQMAVSPNIYPDNFLLYNGSQWISVQNSDSVKLFLQD